MSNQVSDYEEICFDLDPDDSFFNFSIKVQGRNLTLTVLNFGYSRYVALIYWDNSFTAGVYPDIDPAYATLNITHPYDANMQWRFLAIPPGSVGNNEVKLSSTECQDCGFIDYYPNIFTMYTKGNALGRKQFFINRSDASGHSSLYPVGDEIKWQSGGVYTMIYLYNSNTLVMLTDIQPEDVYWPLIMVVIGFFFMYICRFLYLKNKTKQGKRYFRDEKSIRLRKNIDHIKLKRYDFIDTLRGVFLIALVFFMEGGGNYNFFKESLWVGFTFADWPEYVLAWIMGFSIPFNFKNNMENQRSKLGNISYIIGHGMVMLIFGFICNKNNNSATMIFQGYPQYLGVAYIFLNILYLFFPSAPQTNEKLQPKKFFKQPNVYIKFAVLTTILLAHTLIVLLAKAPGCPRAYLGPGGITNHGKDDNCTGGLYGYIDRQVFTQLHMAQDPACQYMYDCSAFSRYSILGFFTFLYGVYLGLLTGQHFLEVKPFEERAKFLGIQLVLTLSIGSLTGLTSPHMHTAIIPISKALWSLSFIMLANFMTCLFVLFFYSLEEQWGGLGWPFKAIGKNTPLIYVLSILLGDRFPFSYQHNGSHWQATVSHLLSTTIWMYMAVQLHKYRFYIRY